MKNDLKLKHTEVKLGMMRFVLVIIDLSESMNGTDFKPDRYSFMIKCLEEFGKEFLSTNPAGQIGLALTYDRNSTILSPLTGL